MQNPSACADVTKAGQSSFAHLHNREIHYEEPECPSHLGYAQAQNHKKTLQ